MKALVVYRVEIQYPGLRKFENYMGEKAAAIQSASVAHAMQGAQSAVYACVCGSENGPERVVKEYGVAS
jgi:hypothetical protein